MRRHPRQIVHISVSGKQSKDLERGGFVGAQGQALALKSIQSSSECIKNCVGPRVLVYKLEIFIARFIESYCVLSTCLSVFYELFMQFQPKRDGQRPLWLHASITTVFITIAIAIAVTTIVSVFVQPAQLDSTPPSCAGALLSEFKGFRTSVCDGTCIMPGTYGMLHKRLLSCSPKAA